jgi:hypothetical protein
VDKRRIGCKECNWKGYKKFPFWNGEKQESTVTICSFCKDEVGYGLYIKNKYGKSSLENNFKVIDFNSYKIKKEIIYIDGDDKLDKS